MYSDLSSDQYNYAKHFIIIYFYIPNSLEPEEFLFRAYWDSWNYQEVAGYPQFSHQSMHTNYHLRYTAMNNAYQEPSKESKYYTYLIFDGAPFQNSATMEFHPMLDNLIYVSKGLHRRTWDHVRGVVRNLTVSPFSNFKNLYLNI